MTCQSFSFFVFSLLIKEAHLKLQNVQKNVYLQRSTMHDNELHVYGHVFVLWLIGFNLSPSNFVASCINFLCTVLPTNRFLAKAVVFYSTTNIQQCCMLENKQVED